MKVQRECPVCGVTYDAEVTRLKFGRQTTCSRGCSYRLRATKKENKIAVTCAVCGQDFHRSPSQIKGKHGSNFCSSACHYAGRATGATKRVVEKPYNISEGAHIGWAEGAKKTREKRIAANNYGHTEATRIKLSEKTACAISEGRIPVCSKLEDVVAAVLDTDGVEYVRQFAIRNTNGPFSCTFDFLLPNNVALEVNGTFWHSDPRFFPDGPVHAIQTRNAAKWAFKLTQASEREIRVVEVWEHDIKQDATQAVRKALGTAV